MCTDEICLRAEHLSWFRQHVPNSSRWRAVGCFLSTARNIQTETGFPAHDFPFFFISEHKIKRHWMWTTDAFREWYYCTRQTLNIMTTLHTRIRNLCLHFVRMWTCRRLSGSATSRSRTRLSARWRQTERVRFHLMSMSGLHASCISTIGWSDNNE